MKKLRQELEERNSIISELNGKLKREKDMSDLIKGELETTRNRIEELRKIQRLGSDSNALASLYKELEEVKE